MDEIERAKTALRASRDALVDALEADPRWGHLHQLNSALAALGDDEAALVIPGRPTASTEPGSGSGNVRPPAAEIEDLGTYPLLRAIMSSDPNLVWKIGDLQTEMEARGWETEAGNKRNAIGTALLRLTKLKEAQNVGRGKYRWGTGDPADEQDAGEVVTETPDAEPQDVNAADAQPRLTYEPPVDLPPGVMKSEAPMSG